jgi:hypothetical protein
VQALAGCFTIADVQAPANVLQPDAGAVPTPSSDNTSLVAQITTRSGLGAQKVFGNLDTSYGSFGTAGVGAGLGFGNHKIGNFLAMDVTRSGRFLDTPEFTAFHDKGNNESIFDRLGFQPDSNNVFHFNFFTARNWIQIPNSYDQLSQGQRQRVMTWSIAPGYQHTVNAHTLLTINPYIRKDDFFFYGSRDPFADAPSTQSQARQLMNFGVKADIAMTVGHHDLKFGIDA